MLSPSCPLPPGFFRDGFLRNECPPQARKCPAEFRLRKFRIQAEFRLRKCRVPAEHWLRKRQAEQPHGYSLRI